METCKKLFKEKNKAVGRRRVVIAMSGGIDSSVAAALLKESGDFEVIGVFMKFWREHNIEKNQNKLCSSEAEKRARKVAVLLKIPFYVFDFKREFKKKIVDCFLNEIRQGVTPNPCVVCNKEIKFGLLFEKAKRFGADFIATGHYACLREGKEGIKLMRAKDKNKDQSYFLWRLSQKQLEHVLFPIGGYTRQEVEKLSKKFKLPLSGVSKSLEICFVGDTINDFLRSHLSIRPGKIITSNGKVLGTHNGLWFYTIGQRKGIMLPGGPYYVLDKDIKKNLLIVTKNERDLYKKEVGLKEVNWILKDTPRFPLSVKAKIRHRHKSAEAVIVRKNKRYRLQFKRPQRAITPGQSAVFYKGNQVLGGAVIY